MHGLGDTADGWASLMPMLDLKETKFILPTANERPITLNGGYVMPTIQTNTGINNNVITTNSTTSIQQPPPPPPPTKTDV